MTETASPAGDWKSRTFDIGIDAPFTAASMVILIIWGWVTLETGDLDSGDSCSSIILIFTGISGFLGALLLRNKEWRTGLLSAVILLCFGSIGIFGSHTESSAMFALVGKLTHHNGVEKFIPTDRARWEVIALVSTAYMVAIYFDLISSCCEGFKRQKGILTLGSIQLVLLISVICLVVALFTLHNTPIHFGSLFLVACLFGVSDIIVWKSLISSQQQKYIDIAHESKCLLFILDIPIIIGMFAVLVYGVKLSTIGCPLVEPSGNIPKIDLFSTSLAKEVGCSEAFPFLAGATAFQMIAFNTMYVVFQFGWHKQKETDQLAVSA